jgi:hypothetical protein
VGVHGEGARKKKKSLHILFYFILFKQSNWVDTTQGSGTNDVLDKEKDLLRVTCRAVTCIALAMITGL